MQSYDSQAIDAECNRLGYRKGWSFLATPEESLHRAGVGLVGLNPGGGGANDGYAYEGLWDFEGNAYFDENWGPNDSQTAIQKQVQRWHGILGIGPAESMCAHFVPFRSPDWASLDRKAEAVSFASGLWRWVLAVSPATLFVTMGKMPAEQLALLLEARHVARLDTGWGNQLIDVWDAPCGRRVVGMPHPSWYALFSRANAASELAEASFRAATGR